jgi:RNA polymerase sigma-70 factor (ECF subfamily)
MASDPYELAPEAAQGDVTRLLSRLREGESKALDELLPRVYGELRRLAQYYMKGERPDHTLQATALVHEAYVRLVGTTQIEWKDRAHFLAVAAQAMRRILVDHARHKNRGKRGGGRRPVPLDEVVTIGVDAPPVDMIALDEALTRLAQEEPRKAKVVELLYFGDLRAEEAAAVLGVNERTVGRDWRFAKAWLARELGYDDPQR